MAAENRDFLAEFEQLRVETDGIRNVLVSKPVQYQNLLKEMMGELKEMRKENLEMQQKNEKKLEELKMQNLKMEQKMEEKLSVLKNEILAKMEKDRRENEKKLDELRKQNLELKKEIVEQNLKVEQKREENEKKLEELRKEVLKLSEKKEKSEENPAVPENDAEATRKIPIRQAVLGEWKMVGHENWEEARYWNSSFEKFSENLKFELVDGKLKQSGAGHLDRIEGDCEGVKKLYVEDDHLKTIWSRRLTEDIYIQNGRLHDVHTFYGVTWKRFYEKL